MEGGRVPVLGSLPLFVDFRAESECDQGRVGFRDECRDR